MEQGVTYAYDFENRPTSITSGGVTTTFVYDGDGGRVKKILNGVTTVYVGKQYECVANSCTKFIFAAGQRIAMKQVSSGVVDYFHSDHLGSTSVITTASGTQEQAVTYYPFGGTRTNTGSVNVPYKYTGKELDETGLYFYEARYYDPALGRFISADTLISSRNPQDLNRYTYALNNPFRYTDPNGHGVFGDVLRGLGWYFNPMLMQFIDPYTRNYTLPVAAGVIGSFGGIGPPCGGAASGAVSASLSGGNISRSATSGAVAATVAWGVGGGMNYTTGGDHQIASAFVAGLAGGTTSAAMGGGDVWRSALISASVSALTAISNFKERPRRRPFQKASSLRLHLRSPMLVKVHFAEVSIIVTT